MSTGLVSVALAILGSVTPAEEADPSPPAARETEIVARGASAGPAERSPSGRAAGNGVGITSADGYVRIRLGAVLQLDGRFFPSPGGVEAPATFLVRRARPVFELALGELFDLRLMPDFGEGKAAVYDAYVDIHPRPWLRLRAGKMKTEVGLQRLQSDQYYEMIERALPTGLVPTRDVGVQLHGEVEGGLVAYAVGVFNGAADRSSSSDVDLDGNKEVAGRVFVHPFRATALAALANVGAGVAGSYGRERGSPSRPDLPSYLSSGQLPFFAYRKEAFAAGERTRVSPGLYAYVGPVGLIAEYARSSQRVAAGTAAATLAHSAWQATLGVVVTGEDASFSGVSPARPVDAGGPGAFEVVTRVEAQQLDRAAFPAFADPETAARRAQGLGAGLNWYLTDRVKASADYERTSYDGGAATGDRPAENAVVARLQMFL